MQERGSQVICKYCLEPIEKNKSKVHIDPQPTGKYVHLPTHLFSCFDANGNPTGRQAEPEESE
jgi:hypothetical protein